MSSRQHSSQTPTVASQDEEPRAQLQCARDHLVLPDAAPYPLSSSKQQSLARSSYTYTRSTHAYIHVHAQHTSSTSYHTYQQHTDNLQGHSQESTNSTANIIETRSRHRPCLATELSAARMLSASPSSQLPLVTIQLRSRFKKLPVLKVHESQPGGNLASPAPHRHPSSTLPQTTPASLKEELSATPTTGRKPCLIRYGHPLHIHTHGQMDAHTIYDQELRFSRYS
ncbi:hypothetical protein CF327_g4229 [Tilletia walkeri]|nr:hypothetical protein CF327_g4229 [Tilletia walkeri]